MNTLRNHRATGFTTDRLVAKYPWQVRTADGRLLAGANTKERAEATALKLNQGRAEPVRVVARKKS